MKHRSVKILRAESFYAMSAGDREAVVTRALLRTAEGNIDSVADNLGVSSMELSSRLRSRSLSEAAS